MPVFTRRLAVLAAAASLVALVLSGTVVDRLVAVNATLVVSALVDWLIAPRRSAVVITRQFPGVVVLGADTEFAWQLRSTVRRRLHVSVADELGPSLGAVSRRFTTTVPGHGSTVVSTPALPTRRGRHEVAALTVRLRGPLGLAERQTTHRVPTVVRVHPRFRSRREAELRIDRARILDVGLRSVKGRGGGTEFDQLREYTSDDEFRRIDWSATARAGRPIVREYRAERNQTVAVLYDNGRVMAGQVSGVPRAEYAMDATLLLATVATRLGDKCGLHAFDRVPRAVVAPGHSRGQTGVITEALYDLEPALLESDYRAAFTLAATQYRRRSLIVVLTDLVDQAIGDSLLPALPVLRARHLVLVGAIRDPQIVAWAHDPPEDAEAAYRQAAAVRTLSARSRAAALLSAAGATVVDTTPTRLAADLGDAYLDFKARGTL